MKNNIRISIGALLVTGALAISNSALAQENEERTTTTTTTTTAGTVSQFGPEGIVIKTTTSADPVRYSSSKTTTYVDENGKAVSVKTVKSGLPVTIYYTKAGDKLVASKVVVRKAVGESGATETTETTTTTSAGTISEFGSQRIVIKTASSVDPVGYTYSTKTTYVDEDGKPVSIQTVKSGLPVTVYYTRMGDKLMATKVIVRKAVVMPPEIIEEKKTTTTTTTTER